MLNQSVSVDQVIDYLNSLVEADKPAVGALFANRVPCNQAMADHPTAIVYSQNGGWHIGLMGIINGMFGLDKGLGPIAYVFDNGDLVGFTRTIKSHETATV